jgi:hypothetical protein
MKYREANSRGDRFVRTNLANFTLPTTTLYFVLQTSDMQSIHFNGFNFIVVGMTGEGTYRAVVNMYNAASDRNTFTLSGGVNVTSQLVCTSMGAVNKVPNVSLYGNVIVTGLAGAPDMILGASSGRLTAQEQKFDTVNQAVGILDYPDVVVFLTENTTLLIEVVVTLTGTLQLETLSLAVCTQNDDDLLRSS